MSLSKTFAPLGLALFASALLAVPAAADFECVASCRGAATQCIGGAREAFKACKQGFGCEELRGVLREVCVGEDRDHEACREAVTEMRTCMKPCFAGLKEDAGGCRLEVDACIEEECGEDNPLRRLLERFGKHRRP